MSRFWFLVIVIAVLIGSTFLAFSFRNSQEVLQPILFSHKKHIDIGMECVSCHTGSEDSSHAGIPETKQCALCHRPERQFPTTSPELANYISSNLEIPWTQLHLIRRHVYFSHQRHVKLGKIGCDTCHGDVKAMEKPFTRAKFESRQKGMNRCVECHRREKVTTDCLSCHR